MDKYHTLFLSDNGSVYSCGIGVGGRLGHDNEESVLVREWVLFEGFNICWLDSQTNSDHGNNQRNRTRSLYWYCCDTWLFIFFNWKVKYSRNLRSDFTSYLSEDVYGVVG